MSSNEHGEIMRALGNVEGKMDGIIRRMDKQNGTIKEHESKLRKHDIALGKVGLIFSTVIFTITVSFNFIYDWIKTKIS